MNAALLGRLLLVIAGGAALPSCGMFRTGSGGACGSSHETCVARPDAWAAAQKAEDAGASSPPAPGCPGPGPQPQASFIGALKLGGDHVVGSPRQNGEQCCYATAWYCEGRPLVVGGQQRAASLRAGAWA